MIIDYAIAIISIVSSFTAAIIGIRFYLRFGRRSSQWGWLLLTVAAISLAISEIFDIYATFQNRGLTEIADIFAIVTEITLTLGFFRMFNLEIVNDKKNQQKLTEKLNYSNELLSASNELTSSLHAHETLKILLQRTLSLTGSDVVILYLNNKIAGYPSQYLSLNRFSNEISTHERELGPLTKTIISSKVPLILEDSINEHNSQNKTIPENIAALYGFPLIENDDVLGVLFVIYKTSHKLSEIEKSIILSLSDHGALALRNASLFEEVQELSRTDGLTGLANRREFDRNLDLEIKRAHRYNNALSLVVSDVDNFKHINDTYSHSAGDSALVFLADLIRKHMRTTDSAYRFGGDELAIILPNTEPEQAVQFTERLCQNIHEANFIWEGNKIPLSCSFGISGNSSALLSESYKDLFKEADSALYEAKKNRNMVVKFETDRNIREVVL